MKILITCPRAPVSIEWILFFLSQVRDILKTDTFFFMPKSELLFELHNK